LDNFSSIGALISTGNMTTKVIKSTKNPATQALNLIALMLELSTPHFGFEKGKFSFKIQALKAFSTESTAPNPVISVDNLKWNVNLNLLLEDIRYPSKISIETLVFFEFNKIIAFFLKKFNRSIE
jgi:hypothetical protein